MISSAHKITHWQTKDGKSIAITALEDSHLLNIIKYFRKNIAWFKEKQILSAYAFLDTLNGECAQETCENEIRVLEDGCDFMDEPDPEEVLEDYALGYKELKEEAIRRNLTLID
jgi:hypothetical protein